MNINTPENPEFYNIYISLLKAYGHQGWWPLNEIKQKYHPEDYTYPKTQKQIFEIYLGAILTQNTTWHQAEKALLQLKTLTNLNADSILNLDAALCKEAIIPARYSNQKTNYIKNASIFFLDLNGRIPTRKEILNVKGIGNETADCILLYGYKQMEFVIDAYTIRLFQNLGLIPEPNYMAVKHIFEKNLQRDLHLYQEFHALIVKHAGLYYSRKPYERLDPILKKKETAREFEL